MASINGSNRPQSSQPIQKIGIQSSFIAALEYDQNNLTLTTHMKSGAIYQHKFVLPSDWLNLQTSQNHSSTWSRAVKGKKMSVRLKSAKAPNSAIRTGRK